MMQAEQFKALISDLLLCETGARFTCEAFRELCGPGVYLYLKDGQALYVGMGRNALARCIAPRHHKSKAFADYDAVMVWPCKGIKEAQRLEGVLITALRPKLNGRKTHSPRRYLLGTSR